MNVQIQKCCVAPRPPVLLEVLVGRAGARESHPAPALTPVLLIPAGPMSPLPEGDLMFRLSSALVPLL